VFFSQTTPLIHFMAGYHKKWLISFVFVCIYLGSNRFVSTLAKQLAGIASEDVLSGSDGQWARFNLGYFVCFACFYYLKTACFFCGFFFLCFKCIFSQLFLYYLSVAVQVIAWKDSSLKWPCRTPITHLSFRVFIGHETERLRWQHNLLIVKSLLWTGGVCLDQWMS